MAEGKNSFVSYCDWGEIFDELSDEQAGVLVKHLFDYVRDKDPTPKDQLTKMMFIQIQQSLKRDLKKYENIVDRNKKNGSKGGRPKKQEEPKEPTGLSGKPKEPKKADSDSGNVSDTDLDIDNVKEEKKYSDEVLQTYHDCLKYFPSHLHPKNKNGWLKTIDELNRLDKVPFEAITHLVKKTREDEFWSKNFLSMTKLRKTNKDGVKYAIVFNEAIKDENNKTGNQKSKGATDERIAEIYSGIFGKES